MAPAIPSLRFAARQGQFRQATKTITLEEISRPDWLIDTFVMIASDVERRHVTKCAGHSVETDYVDATAVVERIALGWTSETRHGKFPAGCVAPNIRPTLQARALSASAEP